MKEKRYLGRDLLADRYVIVCPGCARPTRATVAWLIESRFPSCDRCGASLSDERRRLLGCVIGEDEHENALAGQAG